MNLFERIERLAENKGLTIYKLSVETGISQSVFSRLKTNSTNSLSMNNANTLAEYFQVDRDWLLTGKGDMLGVKYGKEPELIALIEYKGHFYKATTIEQLEKYSQRIRNNIDALKIKSLE